jgi:hypothetical protein
MKNKLLSKLGNRAGAGLPQQRRQLMKRREFIAKTGLVAGALLSLDGCAWTKSAGRIRWTRAEKSRLFSAVALDGQPLNAATSPAVLDVSCRRIEEAPALATWLGPKQSAAMHGPLRLELQHRLRATGAAHDEDLLEATLTVRNTSRAAGGGEFRHVGSAVGAGGAAASLRAAQRGRVIR